MDQTVAPTPHITQIEARPQPALASIVRNALEDTLADRGSMDARVHNVHGFCGRKQ